MFLTQFTIFGPEGGLIYICWVLGPIPENFYPEFVLYSDTRTTPPLAMPTRKTDPWGEITYSFNCFGAVWLNIVRLQSKYIFWITFSAVKIRIIAIRTLSRCSSSFLSRKLFVLKTPKTFDFFTLFRSTNKYLRENKLPC